MPELSLAPELAPQLARFQEYLDVHATTEGWFSVPSAATWDCLLSRQEARGIQGHLLEIGVWHGKSAALMAQHTGPGPETCMLVDLEMDSERVTQTLERARVDLSCVRLLSCDSRLLPLDPLAIEGFRSFRWIHIDGEHTGDAVISDLAVANTLLAIDGVVVIDDFFSWLYPQITEAVFRYLGQYPDHFSLFLCGNNKAYLARPHRVHEWLAFCKDELNTELEARGVEATLGKTTYPGEMNVFGIGERFEGAAYRGPDSDPDSIRI